MRGRIRIAAGARDSGLRLQRSEIAGPAFPASTAIIAVHPDGATYTQHYFDSRGVVRVYAMTFGGLVWTLERSTPDFTPLLSGQRFVGTLAEDGSAITGQWQTATDGGPWARDFDLTYSRVR